MGAWGLAVQILLPVPLVFLVLLSTPTPTGLRKFIMRVCKRVLALPALGVFTVFHMGMFVSACAFASSLRSTYVVNQRFHGLQGKDGMSPCEKTQQLADKWRQERNFWIATICLLLWVILSRFYSLNKINLELRDQVKGLGGKPVTDTFHAGEPAEPSAPEEVIDKKTEPKKFS